MGVTDYLFAQLDAINHDRKQHLQKVTHGDSKKCQDLIIQYILKEQHDGYLKNIQKPTIFSMIDNFISDHVKSDSKHLDLFHESQENVKMYFLGLANITASDFEN